MTTCSFISDSPMNSLAHTRKYTHGVKSKVGFLEVKLLCPRVGPLGIRVPCYSPERTHGQCTQGDFASSVGEKDTSKLSSACPLASGWLHYAPESLFVAFDPSVRVLVFLVCRSSLFTRNGDFA